MTRDQPDPDITAAEVQQRQDPPGTRLAARFEQAYGNPPTVVVSAPGRVNLIGEHTDYNDGFVLPMAIDRRTWIAASPRKDATARVRSTGVEGELTLDLNQPITTGDPSWTNYVRGPIALAAARGFTPPGFDALLHSDVPAGGGLSSSASIEVATLALIEALTGRTLDPVERALIAQQAENEFAGVPCGIMDQFASSLGRAGHALLIDCRDRSTRYVALDDPDVAVLIVNSNVKHALTGGEYAERRAQCESAARTLGVPALRDADPAGLEAAAHTLDPLAYRRARHVLHENQRTLDAANALEARDYPTVGRLMFASHASLRDDFEVSTPELDTLVELARAESDAGVIGSRMTGGGFGGCSVTIARRSAIHDLAQRITEAYFAATGIRADAFVTTPSDGAGRVK
ncbi:MAG: galactokinase [Planctomycetota bacterium]